MPSHSGMKGNTRSLRVWMEPPSLIPSRPADDTTGPNIDMTEPPRGAWVDGLDSTISGTITDNWSSVSSVTVNDTTVSLDSTGAFEEDMDWDFGINVLETSATDSGGNTSTDTRALIAGDFKTYGQEGLNGLAIRIKKEEHWGL